MATKVAKTHLFRALKKQNYSTCPAPGIKGSFSHNVNIESLPNRIVYASTDSVLPIGRVAVVVKAGARYDPQDAPGLNHVLRASAGLTTSDSSTFGIIRNIQQLGANIQVTGGRDTVTYTLEATGDKIEKGLKFLKDVASEQIFKPWELADNIPRIKYEIASLPPEARVLDLLHKAAFRSGLGNSLYVKGHRIEQIGSETLQHFVSSYFTNSRTTVLGVGVPHGVIKSFASDLEMCDGSGGESASEYYSGEIHKDAPLSTLSIAYAGEAVGLKSEQAVTYSVLAYALGGWSNIKYSIGSSPLAKIFKDSGEPIAASAFNAVHSDSGLFGVVVTAPAHKARAAIQSALGVLKGSISEDDLKRAKAQLKSDVLFGGQNGEAVLYDLATQIPLLGTYTKPAELAQKIDNVSLSDVSAVLRNFSSGKKSLAAFGNTSDAPYLDELK